MRSLLVVPLAILAGFGLSFVGFQVWQRAQAPPASVTADATPAADTTPAPESPAGPFGLRVSLPFSLPVSAPWLPFVGGSELTPTPALSPSPALPPAPAQRRATPTPRRATTPTPAVALTASRATRQYAERVARSLEQLSASNQRYASLRYTWRPGGDAAASGRTALDLHDLARAAQAQVQALERPPPPAGLEELGRTAAAAWAGLGQSAEQYACVVLSEGRDRGCLQRANEALGQARAAERQATLTLARVAEPLRLPTPTPTPQQGDYWAAVAPRLEALRNAADVVAAIVSAHARAEVGNAELCRLPAYLATFTESQTVAPLAPPPDWAEFHQAFVAWGNHYSEGLTSLARFCAALPAPGTTATPPAGPIPAAPPAADLDRARRSFIAGDAERDRFEALLARAPRGPLS